MTEFIIKCPHCNTELQAQNEWLGMEVECPQCQKMFVISNDSKDASSSQDSTQTAAATDDQVQPAQEEKPAPAVYACSKCKKEYDEKTKFCSECGGKVEKVKPEEEKPESTNSTSPSDAAENDDDQPSDLTTALILAAIGFGLPFLLYQCIDWPRTVFWCTLPLWGFCLILLCGNNKGKLAIAALAGVIWWGWHAHTRVEIPPPEQMVKITSQSPAATSAPLEFLGISVNESEEIIKEHLLKKGWMLEDSYPPEEKLHIGKEVLSGKFWLLNDPSNKYTIKAHVSFDSGRIMVTFDSITASSAKFLMKMADNRYEFQNNLKKYNSSLARENILMKQYFATLKGKYNLSQAENSINLEDGLIEFRSEYTQQIKGVYFIGTPDQYNCVIFYNRQAAKKRLQEIRKKIEEVNRNINDI